MWLDQDMLGRAATNRKRWRTSTFPDAAIQFCLSIKCVFVEPLRQPLGMLHSLLKLARQEWPVPNFSTVCRQKRTLQTTLSY